MRILCLILLVAFCATLSGCGNKGPLVVPDKTTQTQPSQPATPPAQPQDSGKR